MTRLCRQTLIDPNPTGHDEFVSFLYYYGWATIAQQVDTNRFVFRIPNLLTKPLFLDHLLNRVRLRIEDVTNFIDNPTESSLVELFTPLLKMLEDEQWCNQLGEDILPALFKLLFENIVGSTLKAEFEVKKDSGGEGFIDIWLQSLVSNKAVIIEFKRIRPNALVVPKSAENIPSIGLVISTQIFYNTGKFQPGRTQIAWLGQDSA